MSDQERPDPLDYRNPATHDPARDPIALRMVQKHTLTSAAAGGLIAAGVGIVIVAGIVVASIMCFILYSLTSSTWIGWWGWYSAFVVLMVPLLFWEERRSAGDYLTDRVRDFSGPVSSRGEFELRGAQIEAAVYTDMLLWGPRAILRGVRILKGENPLDRARRFARGAHVVRQLLGSESAVPVASLVQPGEDHAELRRTLRWLDEHDYVGISADGNRIWLSTHARAELRALVK